MDNGMFTTSDMLRLIGVTAICVGLAWAAQVLGLNVEGTALTRVLWVMAAAAVAGAGAGSIITAAQLREQEISASR